MIIEYSFNFNDLSIDQAEIAYILGYGNNSLPEPFGDYVEMAVNDARNLTDIKGAYK